MFLQTDERLNPIRTWGCYFASICALDEQVYGKPYTIGEILRIWFKNWTENDLDIESAVNDPQGLLDDLSGKLEYVGKRGPDYTCQPGEYEILVFYNDRTAYTHFVLGDGHGRSAWDPILNSVTAREGRVVGKRIFRRKREER